MLTREIEIDGRKVPFKASAAILRLYRHTFGRDLLQDILCLEQAYQQAGEGRPLAGTDLEILENVAYCMAKHADPEGVPATVEAWLDEFAVFSFCQIFPQIVDLWLENKAPTVASKKKPAAAGR